MSKIFIMAAVVVAVLAVDNVAQAARGSRSGASHGRSASRRGGDRHTHERRNRERGNDGHRRDRDRYVGYRNGYRSYGRYYPRPRYYGYGFYGSPESYEAPCESCDEPSCEETPCVPVASCDSVCDEDEGYGPSFGYGSGGYYGHRYHGHQHYGHRGHGHRREGSRSHGGRSHDGRGRGRG